MTSGTQTSNAEFPLVVTTQTKTPIARLILRNDLGQVVQQWLVRQNKCTLGSSRNCNLRCEAPGVAPYHALIVVGARQLFVRALAPRLSRNGEQLNEILLSDEDSTFEISGNHFELSRITQQPPAGKLANDGNPQRMKFTLARPFELSARSAPATTSNTIDSADNEPLSPTTAAADPKWIAELVQAAIEPLECQLQNVLQPIEKLQLNSENQQQLRDELLNERRRNEEDRLAFRELAAGQSKEEGAELRGQLQEFSARQAAAIEGITESVTDVQQQLAALESIVVANKKHSTESDEEQTKASDAQNGAIEQLQTGMVSVSAAIQDLESRQQSAREEDSQWKTEIQVQIAALKDTITQVSEDSASESAALATADLAWKQDIQQQFAQLRESVQTMAQRAEESAIDPQLPAASNIDEQWKAEVQEQFGSLRDAIASISLQASNSSAGADLEVPANDADSDQSDDVDFGTRTTENYQTAATEWAKENDWSQPDLHPESDLLAAEREAADPLTPADDVATSADLNNAADNDAADTAGTNSELPIQDDRVSIAADSDSQSVLDDYVESGFEEEQYFAAEQLADTTEELDDQAPAAFIAEPAEPSAESAESSPWIMQDTETEESQAEPLNAVDVSPEELGEAVGNDSAEFFSEPEAAADGFEQSAGQHSDAPTANWLEEDVPDAPAAPFTGGDPSLDESTLETPASDWDFAEPQQSEGGLGQNDNEFASPQTTEDEDSLGLDAEAATDANPLAQSDEFSDFSFGGQILEPTADSDSPDTESSVPQQDTVQDHGGFAEPSAEAATFSHNDDLVGLQTASDESAEQEGSVQLEESEESAGALPSWWTDDNDGSDDSPSEPDSPYGSDGQPYQFDAPGDMQPEGSFQDESDSFSPGVADIEESSLTMEGADEFAATALTGEAPIPEPESEVEDPRISETGLASARFAQSADDEVEEAPLSVADLTGLGQEPPAFSQPTPDPIGLGDGELAAGAGEEDDASVEDYMRKLLARMRGVPEEEVAIPESAAPQPAPAPRPAAVADVSAPAPAALAPTSGDDASDQPAEAEAEAFEAAKAKANDVVRAMRPIPTATCREWRHLKKSATWPPCENWRIQPRVVRSTRVLANATSPASLSSCRLHSLASSLALCSSPSTGSS